MGILSFIFGYTPNDIARATNKNPKVVRAKLREDYPRSASEHGKRWGLSKQQYDAQVNYWKHR